MDPLVSIIIPNFNNAEYVEMSIQSCVDQRYRNIEVIVVDDASTDDSWGIINKMANKDVRIQTNRQPINRGSNYCRNYGISISKGKYLIFLDSDDYFYAVDSISMFVSNIVDGYDFVFGETRRLNQKTGLMQTVAHAAATKDPMVKMLSDCPITSSIMFSREFFKCNRWDDNLKICQEYTLILTAMIEQDVRYKKFSNIVVVVRIHSSPTRKSNVFRHQYCKELYVRFIEFESKLKQNNKWNRALEDYFNFKYSYLSYNMYRRLYLPSDLRIASESWMRVNRLALFKYMRTWTSVSQIATAVLGPNNASKLAMFVKQKKSISSEQ